MSEHRWRCETCKAWGSSTSSEANQFMARRHAMGCGEVWVWRRGEKSAACRIDTREVE